MKRREWEELGGMGWLGWRKSGYGSRKVYIFIKGAILELARDWTLEGFSGVQEMSPACSLGSRGEGA